MKNKLLTSTAIAGLLAVTNYGVGNAQTTVSGNLSVGYKAVSTDAKGSQTKTNSMRSFGKESQINLTNRGKLNIGMDYVAGFSIEHDGGELTKGTQTTNGDNMFSENLYIDFISGNTTFTVGADHIQNPNFEYINIVGITAPNEVVSGVAAVDLHYITSAGSPSQAFGFGVTQAFPGRGNLSFYYAPDGTTASAGNNSDVTGGTFQTTLDGGQSKYEVGFRGSLGVKGLDAGIYYNSAKTSAFGGSANTGLATGVKYTVGAITGAVQYKETESGAQANSTIESKGVGLGYALSKDLSVGWGYAKTDRKVSHTGATVFLAEKLQAVSIGYNLGPIALGVSAGKVENAGGLTNQDGKTAMFMLNTNF